MSLFAVCCCSVDREKNRIRKMAGNTSESQAGVVDDDWENTEWLGRLFKCPSLNEEPHTHLLLISLSVRATKTPYKSYINYSSSFQFSTESRLSFPLTTSLNTLAFDLLGGCAKS
jgi:hypothetical protein